VFKLCTHFEQNRTIRHRVIDHLARFRIQFYRVWNIFSARFSRVRGLNFTEFGENTGQSWPSYEFVSELRFLTAFLNAGASNLSDVENDPNFTLFDAL